MTRPDEFIKIYPYTIGFLQLLADEGQSSANNFILKKIPHKSKFPGVKIHGKPQEYFLYNPDLSDFLQDLEDEGYVRCVGHAGNVSSEGRHIRMSITTLGKNILNGGGMEKPHSINNINQYGMGSIASFGDKNIINNKIIENDLAKIIQLIKENSDYFPKKQVISVIEEEEKKKSSPAVIFEKIWGVVKPIVEVTPELTKLFGL